MDHFIETVERPLTSDETFVYKELQKHYEYLADKNPDRSFYRNEIRRIENTLKRGTTPTLDIIPGKGVRLHD